MYVHMHVIYTYTSKTILKTLQYGRPQTLQNLNNKGVHVTIQIYQYIYIIYIIYHISNAILYNTATINRFDNFIINLIPNHIVRCTTCKEFNLTMASYY